MPLQSTYPPVTIPENVDLWTFLFSHDSPCIREFPPTKEILTCPVTGQSYTWAALRDAALAFGNGLVQNWGWKKGDVLAFYTPNSIDTPIATLGALFAGATISPSNPMYTPHELSFQLSDSKAKALITHLSCLPTAVQAAKECGLPLDRILLLGPVKKPYLQFQHYTTLSTSVSSSEKAAIDPRSDLAFLVYSSGTTGLPKGVPITHFNTLSNLLQASSTEGRQFPWQSSVQLAILPFFHIYGLTCCVLLSILSGWRLVILPRFDMVQVLKAIQTYKVTFMYVPPPVILAFSQHPDVERYDLSSLRVLHSGAAPLGRELIRKVWERVGVPVKQGYGLSETNAVVCCQEIEDWEKKMGSVGRLMPSMEGMVVDAESGREVREGEEGELWLRGPNVFQGYYNRSNEGVFGLDEKGGRWFKTGDVVRVDEEGNFWIVERVKELIKYNGYPVPPAELEGVLLTHPDVLDACVIGIEDKSLATEVPRAYVVVREGVVRTPGKSQELVDHVAKQVASHKKLRGGVHFVDQVPKSPSGKVLRRIMREQAKKDSRQEGSKL
ncbi:putative 4-coumarate--CoA ligase [Triangularia verruculosa]|uniref:4-coumarate--CoA ligase n=1 Tax=Triangularia verruculosa TaxID=2587418 RepID=A0AAN7AVL9_9PEZI|nr:putative 4-coumarate--CoA ligase [Triangularia verruculosa]